MGSRAVWELVMEEPSGRETVNGSVVGRMAVTGAWIWMKWPVQPVSAIICEEGGEEGTRREGGRETAEKGGATMGSLIGSESAAAPGPQVDGLTGGT